MISAFASGRLGSLNALGIPPPRSSQQSSILCSGDCVNAVTQQGPHLRDLNTLNSRESAMYQFFYSKDYTRKCLFCCIGKGKGSP